MDALDPSLLKPLLAALVSDSSQKPFVATTQNTITAAYQCRDDLSNADCRVQLAACNLLYQVVGFAGPCARSSSTKLRLPHRRRRRGVRSEEGGGVPMARERRRVVLHGELPSLYVRRSAKAVWEMLAGIVLGVPQNRLRRPRESRGGRSGR
ncbi:hypothetical protein Fmac_031531 [Flemingia macrophylla]|uniref:Uncharacterized protein n=1 Tax=Flemingia macrophylla TaxID=520843 RepID=A0ABD1L2A8_9FABA